MQSNAEYEHAVLEVEPSEKHGGKSPDHYYGEADLPIDGFAEIWYPRETDPEPDWHEREAHYHHPIPYRDEAADGPWFAFPDASAWSRSPIWKWQNAPDTENITLAPSYGTKSDGEWKLHCWIRDGEIDLL
jgi:hypothetical protein